MSALVLMGLLLVGAKPAKPPVSLPMPPPPAVKPNPPDPAPEPPPPPAPEVVEQKAPAQRALIDRIQLGAGAGPGFSLQGTTGLPSGVSGSNPIWFRGVARGTLDLLPLGPGTLQALLPIALQGAGFRINVLGFVFEGSLFAIEVMPSARYQAELLKDVFAFAELGIGWGTYQITIAQQFVGYQYAGATGFGVRLGAGIEYRLLDQLHVLIQPVELTSVGITTTVTQGGTTVTQTSQASQFSMILGLVVPL
jgi:hypothetical protein